MFTALLFKSSCPAKPFKSFLSTSATLLAWIRTCPAEIPESLGPVKYLPGLVVPQAVVLQCPHPCRKNLLHANCQTCLHCAIFACFNLCVGLCMLMVYFHSNMWWLGEGSRLTIPLILTPSHFYKTEQETTCLSTVMFYIVVNHERDTWMQGPEFDNTTSCAQNVHSAIHSKIFMLIQGCMRLNHCSQS